MTVKSKKDRLAAMIASLKRAAAGDYSKIIDISGKHDEFDSLAEAMENDKTIGWISAMENGSPVLSELIEAHSLSKKYRIDPKTPYTTKVINKGLELIYEKWGGHDLFCRLVENKQLPLFIPYRKDGRSAVCFMVRPANRL